MMMCSRCKKRPAVVFITTMQGSEKKNEGLCLSCARELNIPQVKEYMEQMGITEEDFNELSDQMMDIMDGEDFEMGGFDTLPPQFTQNLMSGLQSFAGMQKDEDEPLESHNTISKETKSKEKKNEKNSKKTKYKFLDSYCTNLTQKAVDGEIDRIIGRDKEISRVIQILSRRTKNNPCLIGEPGVGKTAIAEGIAQKIASGDVPFNITEKELYLLDLTALVAGTQFRGQFESRVKGLVDEVKAKGNVILFIDEVHNLVGTGDSEGSMNAANLLKPALSRGEVQVIGATTFKEYRKYIEKDSALERRFQPVTITEPTIEDTYNVLLGIREYYEKHHKVKISDSSLKMCAVLSERYINDRFLPDKAIDLLDEACACASIRSTELADMQKLEKQIQETDSKIEEMETAEAPDYEALAIVKAEAIRLKEKADELKPKLDDIKVSENDISKVIELWTGIPANKIIESEYVKISKLEEHLEEKIIGQNEAVHKVANAVKRSRVQLSKRRRPASFIFVGPTGVGKTELVKVLANELFDSVDPLIRLDMTEYMEKHSVSRMIGSPPGYVGYDDAGQLTEKVRRKPYSVILFDEIEKAHPDVMNILLQILDEGRINDAQGRTVNFENTVICMTSNAGSVDKTTGVGFNKTEEEISEEKAKKGLSEFLRPEFLSRVDEVIVFKKLEIEDYKKIAALMLDEMKEPLEEKAIKLSYDKKALDKIADLAYDQKFGARDIRKVIRDKIEDKVADIIIESHDSITKIKISAGSDLTVKGA